MVKKVTLIVFLFLLNAVLLASSEIEILNQTEDIVTFKVKLKDYVVEKKELHGHEYNEILGNFDATKAEAGFPVVPYLVHRIGIPENGSIAVRILQEETEIMRNIQLKPAQELDPENGAVSKQFLKNDNAYRSSYLYPLRKTEIQEKVCIGNRAFIPIHFFPFQFNASKKELKITTEATIQVQIYGNKTKNRTIENVRNYIDNYADDFFINNASSKDWKLPRKKSTEVVEQKRNVVDALQFVVDKEGIYKMDYAYIADSLQAWQDSMAFSMAFTMQTLDPRRFEMYDENGPIPIRIAGEEDGSFDEGDFIEFYGTRHAGDDGYMDTYTEENVYTLVYTDHIGLRFAVDNGGIIEDDIYGYQRPDSYQYDVHFERQNTQYRLGFYGLQGYYGVVRDWREDTYFWKSITAPTMSRTYFDLEYPSNGGQERFDASVMLTGTTHAGSGDGADGIEDHHAIAFINQGFVGDSLWVGQNDALLQTENTNPNEFLNHGENLLAIQLPGDTIRPTEQVVLDYFSLNYWREYKTDKDELRFSKPSNTPYNLYQFDLHNFSSDDITIYKLGSAIMENYRVEPFTELGGAPYTISFQDSIFSDGIEYYITTEEQKQYPKAMRPNFVSNLKLDSNHADYILITTLPFKNADGTIRIKNLWESRGKDVKIVDVQDIYDEFNHGIRSAEAIKEFITYAYHNWQLPQLSHVLLMGDGCFDERDNASARKYNLIPIYNVWTKKLGATASDLWYGCVVGDDLVPEVSIGRINIWEEEQIDAFADKVETYLYEPQFDELWHANITLAAGGKASDGNDIFAQQSERLRRQYIPKEYKVNRVYTSTQTVPTDYQGSTFTLKDNINDGTSYVQFMGHGGGRIWADYNLFNYSDVSTLTNDVYPVFTSLSCYGSSFDTPGGECMGEAIVLAEGRGGIGHIGFSGLGYLYDDEYWGQYLFDALFMKNYPSVGEALNYTVAKFNSANSGNSAIALSAGANYIGDPMVGMWFPENTLNVRIKDDEYSMTEIGSLVGEKISVEVDCPEGFTKGQFYITDKNETLINIAYDLPIIYNDTIDYNIKYDYEITKEDSTKNYDELQVRFFAYNNDTNAFGMTNVSFGKGAMVDLEINPENPQIGEEVMISARFFDEDGIQNVSCFRFRGGGTNLQHNRSSEDISIASSDRDLEYLMLYNAQTGRYELSTPFVPSTLNGERVRFYFVLTNGNGEEQIIKNMDASFGGEQYFYYDIIGYELGLSNMMIVEKDGQPKMKALVENFGEVESPELSLELNHLIVHFPNTDSTYTDTVLVSSLEDEVLMGLERRWVYVPLGSLSGEYHFQMLVNEGNINEEYNNLNNDAEISCILNMFEVGESETTKSSLDGNLEVVFPENTVSENSYFSIETRTNLEPLHQNGIQSISMKNSVEAFTGYKIYGYNDANFADTLGTFLENKSITLKFNYSATDTLIQEMENAEQMSIYRWEDAYQKWIQQGGFINVDLNQMTIEVHRAGTYGLFQKKDFKNPSIEINVEDQEFNIGGLVASDGILSFLISDEDGIDIIDHTIDLFINNEEIAKEAYSINAGLGQLVQIPIKYQLDLPKGDYTASIHAVDVNGNYSERSVFFQVNTDFDLQDVANYPNPVKVKTSRPEYAGRTRFTYTLTDNADSVEMKIFTVSGRLVQTFNDLPTTIGYHEYPRGVYPYDCRDKDGQYLANGVYFYKIIAKKNGKKIEKIQKMAILK